ncbi:MarR family winged helix-turn-helix transcriptional regulator [Rubrimonas cliftonensis]|uniref:DNA-binding transcriptional regulator, MarR family n=1 Tax=Rubrimonas cliftonensis TaxID=89524 RepID=A0A1H3YBN5_9RHOB|nr:MarR family transcriptional regulator [Rubrimonas cliftonensis]SEA08933.1 DNA-binding transcriptional regulator, MarR family [Rubrimonas cliftonensis]
MSAPAKPLTASVAGERAHGGGAEHGSCPIREILVELSATAQMSRAYAENLLPRGLSLSTFIVLDHLCDRAAGATPMRVARALGIPKASLTNTLASLARMKCLAMRPDPRDGRGKQIFVTEAGRETRDAALSALHGDAEAVCATMARVSGRGAAETAAELRGGLAAIRAALAPPGAERAGEKPDPCGAPPHDCEESAAILSMSASKAAALSNDNRTGRART